MSDSLIRCPNCGRINMTTFYAAAAVPTNSVLLLTQREEAITFPRGDIALGLCAECGFIGNSCFDPARTEYSARYEATQGYSPTFQRFHRELAQDLVARFDLRQKTVIEIGCDKGDFLTMLCELGDNRGIGFDPAYQSGRHPSPIADQLTFIPDFYSAAYAHLEADFICCKMTLEHIADTAVFVRNVRSSIRSAETVVFFQVPNAEYVLGDLAFWDVYYEHCSYFTPHALAYLFAAAGFVVNRIWTDYDDQYLMIEAQPSTIPVTPQRDLRILTALQRRVAHFAAKVPQQIAVWQRKWADWGKHKQRVVLWGGGSKAVSFITTLGLTAEDISYVVDINPQKTGTFLAGGGQEVVAPPFLRSYDPHVVIIMNPVYKQEIANMLAEMNLDPTLLTIEDIHDRDA